MSMSKVTGKKSLVVRAAAVSLLVPLLWSLELSPENPWRPGWVGEARALIGRPLTPLSYAGVARRTTRRFVATDAAMMATMPPPPPPTQTVVTTTTPAAAAPALPKGTVVSELPSGCESSQISGETVFACGSVIYKPTFQSGNLVYVVQ
jgi:hypothetical protein